MKHFRTFLLSSLLSACFSAVPEVQCTRDGDCDDAASVCQNSKCVVAPDGGAAPRQNDGGGQLTDSGVAIDAGFSETCGCKDPLGQCQVGDSPFACGSDQAACSTCMPGQQCIDGSCIAAPCGPQTCSGCCGMDLCITPQQQSPLACGPRGGMCNPCQLGQVCQSGACVTSVCDATSCPRGCCLNGQCLDGDSRLSCGTGGAACASCMPGAQCAAGRCGGGVPVDGGVTTADGGVSSVGIPCVTQQDCSYPNGLCIPERAGGMATGYPGGSCTAQCGLASCSSGACITEDSPFGPQSFCRAACTQPGTQSTCRPGYVCQPSNDPRGTSGACRTRCDNTGSLSACPMGKTCSRATGLCL
jgi:hypothetical protein